MKQTGGCAEVVGCEGIGFCLSLRYSALGLAWATSSQFFIFLVSSRGEAVAAKDGVLWAVPRRRQRGGDGRTYEVSCMVCRCAGRVASDQRSAILCDLQWLSSGVFAGLQRREFGSLFKLASGNRRV